MKHDTEGAAQESSWLIESSFQLLNHKPIHIERILLLKQIEGF